MQEQQLDFVPKVHSKMLKQHYLLCYKGHFSQEVTKSLLAMTENKLASDGTDTVIKKRIFKIMMGCLQNICTGEKPAMQTEPKSIFMLGKNEKEFFVFSGSVVAAARVEEMKRKLYAINMMDAQNLKRLFCELMMSLSPGEVSESEITLIDIARKSGKKLEFEFRAIDSQSAFFSMKTVIATMN